MSHAGAEARRLALAALLRIEEGGRANAVLDEVLGASTVAGRDRAFTTELVYGSTRMRRACDFLVDRFVMRTLDPPTRVVLRLGAYQLHFLRTPAHAAVSATVAVAPGRSRGLVNAVLRRVADAPVSWPDRATRLSYPDWVVDRLVSDLGEGEAIAALEHMNVAPRTTERADHYLQDRASQLVAAAVDTVAGERVADLCAAPGGKSTALATAGAGVFATDVDPGRAALVATTAERLQASSVVVAAADGRRPPWPVEVFDRVLVDAPCSGLGVLHRRPDARWRRQPGDIDRLAVLQRELLGSAVSLVRPGGTLVYSVCTLTAAETLGADEWLASNHPTLRALAPPGPPWRPHGRGAILVPQAAGTDGMAMLRLQVPDE